MGRTRPQLHSAKSRLANSPELNEQHPALVLCAFRSWLSPTSRRVTWTLLRRQFATDELFGCEVFQQDVVMARDHNEAFAIHDLFYPGQLEHQRRCRFADA